MATRSVLTTGSKDTRSSQLAALRRLHPGKQVVGRPGVDHAFQRDLALRSTVAAERLPFQLSGRVGVGVDGEVAPVREGDIEQLLRRVEPTGGIITA